MQPPPGSRDGDAVDNVGLEEQREPQETQPYTRGDPQWAADGGKGERKGEIEWDEIVESRAKPEVFWKFVRCSLDVGPGFVDHLGTHIYSRDFFKENEVSLLDSGYFV